VLWAIQNGSLEGSKRGLWMYTEPKLGSPEWKSRCIAAYGFLISERNRFSPSVRVGHLGLSAPELPPDFRPRGNMLAPLFGREPELSSVYPQDVWTYLNTVPAADRRIKVPWKGELIAEWVKAGRIGSPA
jgi:hypothetical protein